ncbi:hypothetical protein A6J71_13460 [Enterobacter cancerogenus]|jgi:hypothetical protein|nr:hypothetical protein A6J71_13460 [Enterobacter cancerogenus]
MYSYDDVERIKTNLEWIVHQSSSAPQLPNRHDQKAIYKLLELIQTYELLLDLIKQFGVSVIDAELAEGISVTETFITKVKRNDSAM